MNDKEKLNACLRELSTANAARKFLYDENQRLQAISCKPAKQWYVAHVQRVMLDGEPLFKADWTREETLELVAAILAQHDFLSEDITAICEEIDGRWPEQCQTKP